MEAAAIGAARGGGGGAGAGSGGSSGALAKLSCHARSQQAPSEPPRLLPGHLCLRRAGEPFLNG